MRLNHIYITKQGEPMANPGMEYPKPLDFYDFEVDDGDFQKADDDYNEALEKYHSGLLPFEDRELALMCVPSKNRIYSHGQIAGYSVKPDTLIPVDIEVEVVKQSRFKGEHLLNDWIDSLDGDENHLFEYRKVLRIKP